MGAQLICMQGSRYISRDCRPTPHNSGPYMCHSIIVGYMYIGVMILVGIYEMTMTIKWFNETHNKYNQWCSRKYLGTGAVQNISMVLFLERKHKNAIR